MKVFPVLAASTVLMASAWLPALARDSFVKDDAALFTPQTVSALNTKISSFNAQTGKEIVVATVPSLQGATIKDAGERAYAQQQVNGVLIFNSKKRPQGHRYSGRCGSAGGMVHPRYHPFDPSSHGSAIQRR